MIKVLNEVKSLSEIKGKRLAILISIVTKNCESACPFKHLIAKNDNIENVIAEVLNYIKSGNEITCTVSLCKISTVKNIALCTPNSLNVAKHKYDEVLKCLTFSDIVLVITKDMSIVKLFSNLVCLAKIEGIEIILLSIS